MTPGQGSSCSVEDRPDVDRPRHPLVWQQGDPTPRQ